MVLSERCLNRCGKELKFRSALMDRTFYSFALISWQHGTSYTRKMVKCKWVLPYMEGRKKKRCIPYSEIGDLIRDSVCQNTSVLLLLGI